MAARPDSGSVEGSPPSLAGSEGNPDAEIWIIGRDYGSTEQARGLPFQGRAGQILNRALTAAGLRRDDVFIDNVVRAQPPSNDWTRHPPGAVESGTQRLRELIDWYKPQLVVALGNEAFHAVMGTSTLPTITEARGYLFDGWWGGTVLPTVHPAFCDRTWVPWRALLDCDLRKAKAELTAGPRPKRQVIIITEPHEYQDVRNAVRAAPLISVDIENDAELHLRCCGFGVRPDLAYVVPATSAQQLAFIKELCEGPNPKVLQNGQYDRFFLKHRCGIELTNQVFDTQLGWHALQPELAGQKTKTPRKKGSRTTVKSLRFLASLYTRDSFWKDYDFSTEEERFQLCGLDCCITLEIAQKMMEEMR